MCAGFWFWGLGPELSSKCGSRSGGRVLEVQFYSGPGENNFAEQIWYGGGGGGGNRGFWFESGSGGGLGSGRAEQSRVGGL